MNKYIITSIILTLSFSVNAQNWWKNKRVKGNGNVITKTRTISDFDKVDVGGSFDVILVKGEERKITINGEENIIKYVETKVFKNNLQVKYQNNTSLSTTKKLTVTIMYNDIEEISLSGSGNIINKGVLNNSNLEIRLGGSGNITLHIDSGEVQSSIAGSGNIKLQGKSNELECSIAGSGNIKAYGLITNILSATITGSGNIKSTVKNEIKAKVIGSGNIYYKGNPSYVDSKSLGSGDVINKN
jgi:hypothetical protein